MFRWLRAATARLPARTGGGAPDQRQRRREDLDCDIPPQAGVAGSIHFTYAASADQGNDFIGAEFRTRRQSHVQRDYTLKKE
jgi:hypothetical protein